MSMRARIGRGALCVSVLLFLFTTLLFVGIFYRGRAIQTVRLSQEYYFLVRDCRETTADAVAGDIYLSGGAGYLLDDDEVVVACYYAQTDAEYVRGVMESKGVDTRVVALQAKSFSLNGKRAASRARVEANAQTVDSCARILFDAANGLERAEIGQEEARAAVRGVVKSLAGLRGGNEEGVFSLWNVALLRAERRGKELAEGILFSKDLRYLQVALCVTVLHCADCFS